MLELILKCQSMCTMYYIVLIRSMCVLLFKIRNRACNLCSCSYDFACWVRNSADILKHFFLFFPWTLIMKSFLRTLSPSLIQERLLLVKIITKTRLCNFDPLKPHFYIVKLGFTGVYIIFHISAQNIDCGYSLEPPRRGGSNEYPQSMF